MDLNSLWSEIERRGLVKSGGSTPVATLGASLYRAIQRNPDGRLMRIFKQGTGRAIRGTVQWTVRDAPPGRSSG